jgi:DNA-binding MarR family transcriptional regulator
VLDDAALDLLIGYPNRLSRLHAAILARLPERLTFRQYRHVSRVAAGYTSMSQLAVRGNLSLPTVSENVDGLVSRGLMTTQQNKDDRRAVVLGVTPLGRKAAAEAEAKLDQFYESLFSEVDAEDLAIFLQVLGHIHQRATDYFRTEQMD